MPTHHETYFVLPPLAAHYYRRKNPTYEGLPPWHPQCRPQRTDEQVMQLVYPRYPAEIYVPIDREGKVGATIFSVAHDENDLHIYWHLDNEFLATTQDFHSLELSPSPGEHNLVLVDELGRRLVQNFTILRRKEAE